MAAVETDENLNFDEMILEAAKGIMAASSALVRAANAAQRELVDQGKVARRPLTSSDDGQWSEGLNFRCPSGRQPLLSSLEEAAQHLVQGTGTRRNGCISTAKQGASFDRPAVDRVRRLSPTPTSKTGRRLQGRWKCRYQATATTNPAPNTTTNTPSTTNNLMNVEQQFAKLNLENHDQVQLRQHHHHLQQQQQHQLLQQSQQHFRTSPLNPAAAISSSSSSGNNGTTMVNVLDSSSQSSAEQRFSSSSSQQQVITKKIHMTTSSTSSSTMKSSGGEWK
ncbi:talin [Culex quinquefasciatus]|uniref:Talin n=1 Tax=Culex quinquefasciatus TaxID=7176 RepID=B0WLZ6_CULQU|nr:talin [Culex quinquefasciatus]|eukprot:XP_001849730.1 talin [Culex quinquefasciatus]